MTHEQKDKLEQAATQFGELCDPNNETLEKQADLRFGFLRGAQTILENPKEWGLCQKYDVAKERTKWVKAYSHNDKEKNSSLMHQVNEIEELQSQLTKYREALEQLKELHSDHELTCILIEEALKQEVNNDTQM